MPAARFAAPVVLALSLACAVLCGPAAGAGEQEPAPTAVPVTAGLAASLRDVKDFGVIEDRLGGPGATVKRSEESDGPHVVRAWRDGRGGSARAFLFDSGDFSIVLREAGSTEDIVLNSFGAFVCPTCTPPVNACGRRPWWVPHDVHFDTFDCGCTLAGPQSAGVGRC